MEAGPETTIVWEGTNAERGFYGFWPRGDGNVTGLIASDASCVKLRNSSESYLYFCLGTGIEDFPTYGRHQVGGVLAGIETHFDVNSSGYKFGSGAGLTLIPILPSGFTLTHHLTGIQVALEVINAG